VNIAFTDYKKAFASVRHAKLWTILKDTGISETTVNTLKTLYRDQQAAVRVDTELTDWFPLGKGVRQGCLVSPLSFNCHSERVMRESADELNWIGVTVSGRTLNNLMYAEGVGKVRNCGMRNAVYIAVVLRDLASGNICLRDMDTKSCR